MTSVNFWARCLVPALFSAVAAAHAQSQSAIRLDPTQRQAVGLTLGQVELRPMVKTIRAAVRIDYDERKIGVVTLKVGGWVDELYVDAVGAAVERGAPLLRLYSPDLLTAEREYLLARDTARRLRDSTLPEATASAQAIVDASRERLLQMVQVIAGAVRDGVEPGRAGFRRSVGVGHGRMAWLRGTDDADEDAAQTRVVQLDEEDPLPGAERHASVHDRDGLARAEEQVLDVGVAVGALVGIHVDGAAGEVVVLVVGVRRGEVAQDSGQVAEQERLVLIDLDGGRGVLGEDGHLAELDSRLLYDARDVVGDVDELERGHRLVFDGLADDA